MINQGSKAEYSQKYSMQGNELQFANNLIYPAGGEWSFSIPSLRGEPASGS